MSVADRLPSWSHPSGICDIPFAVHHFLLRAGLHLVFRETFSVLEPRNVFMHVPSGKEGTHGKKFFFFTVCAECLDLKFCFMKYIFHDICGETLSPLLSPC